MDSFMAFLKDPIGAFVKKPAEKFIMQDQAQKRIAVKSENDVRANQNNVFISEYQPPPAVTANNAAMTAGNASPMAQIP
eukprot:2456650-Rhodomonas_salina.1